MATTSKPFSALPWSYSSLTAFETCPRRFYLTRVTRVITEAQTEATLHGNAVHKALENHITGVALLPEKYAQYRPIVAKVKASPGKKLVEYKFGVTSALQRTDYGARDCWYRGVIDLAILNPQKAVLLDWKTGKRKADHDQLSLFALAGMAHWQDITRVDTGYVWLASGQLDTKTYTREDIVPIGREFATRVKNLETAVETGTWHARPSGLCRAWCPVGKQNCQHCGS